MREKLTDENPALAAQWDHEKNGKLRPEDFTGGSHKKVWWRCALGHSWFAAIYSRSVHGCPYCSGRRAIPGVSDLLTVNPKLADEWDCEKNMPLQPRDVSANTHRKVWWRCSAGHSWEAAISNRNNGNGCPYCANRYLLKGFNDLLSIAPELCEEWDFEKNAPLRPDEIVCGLSRKVWWRCEKSHCWQARIPDRRKGTGCPVCAGKVVVPGENDLKTVCPDIAAQWDDAKNEPLHSEHVTAQSTRKVWWVCERGHSYISTVYNRYYGNGCPYCAGNRPIIGETDLKTVHPELVLEWDFKKNGSKKPEDYTCGSNQKLWWKCPNGEHSWKASVFERCKGCGCPYCAGKLAISGKNDAATLFPKLISEWDSEKNRGLTLQRLLPNSSQKAWWKCKRGHRWKTSIQSRTNGTGCPYCKGKTPMRTRLVK